MTRDTNEKNEEHSEKPTEALPQDEAEEQAGAAGQDEDLTGEDVPEDPDDRVGTGRFASKNLKIAAAGVAAVLAAGVLFLAPGDRLLGIDSSSAGIERHHDGDGEHGEDFEHGEHGPGENREGPGESGYHEFDDDGPGEESADHDRPGSGAQWEGGSSYSTPSDQPPLGTSQS